MNNTFIKVKNLGMTFHTKEKSLEVLKKINFTVKRNQFVVIIGPSGCGKTTLLKIIGGLIRPTEGSVTIDNVPVDEAKKEKIFGFNFQNPTLLPWRSVLQNVLLPLEITKDSISIDLIEKSEKLLKIVGIYDFKNNYPNELSGGMQQRVAIARSLSFNPSILLMDEPFGSLDEITRNKMNSELLKIQKIINHTIIFVTHSISEAIFLADKIIVLSKRPGRIKKIIKINFSKPRNIEIKDEMKFARLIKKVNRSL